MGYSSDTLSKLQQLAGSIGMDGSVLPGKETIVNYLVDQIKSVTGVDISVVNVENPETHELEQKIKAAEYVDQSGTVVPETIYNSPTEMYDGITAAGEYRTASEYFDDNDVYMGVLSTTGGENLARALAFASGSNLQYSIDSSYSYIHHLKSTHFNIDITESNGTDRPAGILLTSPGTTASGAYLDPISPFNDEYAASEGIKYIKYYIRKGSTGDCYLKGFFASNDDVPTEEDFDECTMNIFVGYTVDGQIQKVNTASKGLFGGFSLVQMEDKVTKKDPEGYFEKASMDEKYAFVLWRDNGSPFHIGYPGVTKWNADYATFCWNRIITNSDEQVVALAPIFGPGSIQAASTKSFWSMITSKEGVYKLTVGDGGTYFYDHGFALEID